MPRGLGATQRRLLGALYSARLRPLLRWKVTHGGEELTFQRQRPRGGEFCLLSQLGLAELHVPSLRDRPRRSAKDFSTWNWFSLNSEPTTENDRDLLRSWRAAYRRAGTGLDRRGLIEIRHEILTLQDLGQSSFISINTRAVVMARITDTGRQYVEQRRAEFIDDEYAITDLLRSALRANGFSDVAEAPVRLVPHQATRRLPGRRQRRNQQPRHRHARHSGQKQHRSAQPAPPAPIRPLSYEELVIELTGEGFTAAAVQARVREWHRKEQRELLELYGDKGTPLPLRLFDFSEVSELRQLLLAD